MTEQEWLSSTRVRELLSYVHCLKQQNPRKESLFHCACCRRILHLVHDPLFQRAVAVREGFADGLVSWNEVCRVNQDIVEAGMIARQAGRNNQEDEHARIASLSLTSEGGTPGDAVAEVVQHNAKNISAWALELELQADYIRDVFGNPFRDDPVISTRWLEWGHGTVPAMAQRMYDERRFEEMPILADALQDSGCNDSGILDHCRGDKPHVRGCWVVDLILAEEYFRLSLPRQTHQADY